MNPLLLFVGTEFGIYFTTNGGEKWKKLGSGLPTIAVRDIEIQKRENDLVIATFGRGFYILDDYSPIREFSSENFENDAYSFQTKTDDISYSGSCWTGMLTGVWHNKHNVLSNKYLDPNIDEFPHFFNRVKTFNSNLRFHQLNTTIL